MPQLQRPYLDGGARDRRLTWWSTQLLPLLEYGARRAAGPLSYLSVRQGAEQRDFVRRPNRRPTAGREGRTAPAARRTKPLSEPGLQCRPDGPEDKPMRALVVRPRYPQRLAPVQDGT